MTPSRFIATSVILASPLVVSVGAHADRGTCCPATLPVADAPLVEPIGTSGVQPEPECTVAADEGEAASIFNRLVDRYRAIEAYQDTARLVQVTRHPGERQHRIETEIACEVSGDSLEVQTPQQQARKALGLGLPRGAAKSPAATSVRLRYFLWLAPHMSLKFADEPLQQLRDGIDGLTATDTSSVTIDDKPMVQIGLTSSGEADGDAAARFDLFIDPESLLVERIEGHQRLPDGSSYDTTLEIQPGLVIPSTPEAEPAIGLSDPYSPPG